MKRVSQILSVIMVTCAMSIAYAQEPIVGRMELPWWSARLTEKEALATRAYDTVFVGDSITHNWDVLAPELQKQAFGDVLNLGFSGDRTNHVLWRIQRIDWKTVAPKRIMLMIGTNDTGHSLKAPAEIYAGIQAIVEHLKAQCPQAKILVLKIFPRCKLASDPRRVNNDAVNVLIDQLAEDGRVEVKDIASLFLEADGLTLDMQVMPDALHPNAEGYRRWAEAVAPEFMKTQE